MATEKLKINYKAQK